MNILTFMASSAAIAPAFFLFAQAGLDHVGSISDLFPTLRKIGFVFEKRLLEATKGVNTQRGILFSAGLLGGCASFFCKSQNNINIKGVLELVRDMTRGLVAKELRELSPEKTGLTAGQKLYLRYGITGIRGEAEAGFPSILNRGLPALKNALGLKKPLNESLVHSLISIMTELEDTTVIWRAGKRQLIKVQQSAREILKRGSIFTPEGWMLIHRVDEEFKSMGISPGGSADLLALSMGSYLLEKRQIPSADFHLGEGVGVCTYAFNGPEKPIKSSAVCCRDCLVIGY
jgi:triphosphoribosyl-dephospho-CoA synthase